MKRHFLKSLPVQVVLAKYDKQYQETKTKTVVCGIKLFAALEGINGIDTIQ